MVKRRLARSRLAKARYSLVKAGLSTVQSGIGMVWPSIVPVGQGSAR